MRPVVPSIKNIEPNGLAGFVSAEGNFFVRVADAKTKVGKQVVLMFSISQHSRDADLLRAICDLWGCGEYYPHINRDEGNFTVTKFSDIDLKIIPFFKQYPIIGVKSLYFSDLSEVVDIVRVKQHLTEEGLANIENIKSHACFFSCAGMNIKRIY